MILLNKIKDKEYRSLADICFMRSKLLELFALFVHQLQINDCCSSSNRTEYYFKGLPEETTTIMGTQFAIK